MFSVINLRSLSSAQRSIEEMPRSLVACSSIGQHDIPDRDVVSVDKLTASPR